MNMNTTTTILAASLLAISLSACVTTSTSSATPEPGPATNQPSPRTIPYPLDTCIVTDNELGSMGDPITSFHGNREVKFCCRPCVRKFDANPDRYLAKLGGL